MAAAKSTSNALTLLTAIMHYFFVFIIFYNGVFSDIVVLITLFHEIYHTYTISWYIFGVPQTIVMSKNIFPHKSPFLFPQVYIAPIVNGCWLECCPSVPHQ